MKTTITIIAAFLVFFGKAQAQDIIYHDVYPDKTVSATEAFSVHGIDITHTAAPNVLAKTWEAYEILTGASDTLPLALNHGAYIGTQSIGAWKQLHHSCLNCNGAVGYWTGLSNKYLAFRYKDAQNQYRYGWVLMDVAANASSFTIKEYALNTLPSTPMTAGQMFSLGIDPPSNNTIKPVVHDRFLNLLGQPSKAGITVTDMSGRPVLRGTLKPGERMDLSAYPSGMYLLHVRSGDIQQGFKIVLP